MLMSPEAAKRSASWSPRGNLLPRIRTTHPSQATNAKHRSRCVLSRQGLSQSGRVGIRNSYSDPRNRLVYVFSLVCVLFGVACFAVEVPVTVKYLDASNG